jgi:hypothetical protein
VRAAYMTFCKAFGGIQDTVEAMEGREVEGSATSERTSDRHVQ